MIQLLHGDCLKLMFDLPDNSVDMVCCDMPFGTTQNLWDFVLPLDMLWHHYNRICKKNAAIVLFSQQPFTTQIIASNKTLFRYELIWEKPKAGGFLNANKMPLRAHENIVVFYSKLPTYNPQKEPGKPYIKKAVSNGDGKNYGKFDRTGQTAVNSGDRFPRSVLMFKNDNHNSLHPTQKPVALIEYLIKTYTNEGDTVLDNCMGSGTTGVACQNLNRNFIGIEMDDKYFQIGKERIEATEPVPELETA